MANRVFDKCSAGVDRKTSAFRITCHKCGSVGIQQVATFSGNFAPELLAKKWVHKGWTVGKRATDDRCPSCSKRKATKPVLTVVEEVSMEDQMKQPVLSIAPVPTIPRADPPPVMTKEDRRIIFAKIDEHYIDETTGYSAGWSDERVALDLNVPRAWVSEIREQNFGPAVNPAFAEEIGKIEALIERAQAIESQVMQAREEITLKAQEASDLWSAIRSEIDAAAGRLKEMKRQIAA